MAMAGVTIRGVFNTGYRKLFVDPQTPVDRRIKELEERFDLSRRIVQRQLGRINALEEEVEKLKKVKR